MYSYELNEYLGERNYFFESFHEFECIREKCPQVRYSLKDENDYNIVLHLFTSDNYEWDVYIKK